MEWQIKTIARGSALSGETFKPGSTVVCLVFKDAATGELGRIDLLPDELDRFELADQVLGRWTRVVKDSGEAALSAQETMASAEDFFFSLFENENESPEARESSDMLKHLLSLMLERKRVLRSLGTRQTSGSQTYLHVKSKRTLEVPIAQISTELMLKLENTIGDIML